jgi:hypothetical protein
MIAVTHGARVYTAAVDCGRAKPKDKREATIIGQAAGPAPWREVLEWRNYFSVQSSASWKLVDPFLETGGLSKLGLL